MGSFTSVSLSSPISASTPVKPSDNSGADRLARNKEGARGEEGKFDSFFKSGTKHPPPRLPLSVCLFPPTAQVYLQSPNLFSTPRHPTFERNLIKPSLMGLWPSAGWTQCPCTVVSVNLWLCLFVADLFSSPLSSLIAPVPAATVFGLME